MPIIITSYRGPDLDGVACAYAYAELLRQQGGDVIAMTDGNPTTEAQWVLERLNITIPSLTVDGTEDIILVDASQLEAINVAIKPEKVIEIIDHHLYHDAEVFKEAKIQIESVGAAATLVAERFQQKNITPSEHVVTLLYGGIISNTLNFVSSVTTERDGAMATWLLQKGMVPQNFIHDMFAFKSDFSQRKMKDVIQEDLYFHTPIGSKKFSIGQLEIINARRLLQQRYDELYDAMVKIKEEQKTDYAFLSLIDLEEGFNYFLYTSNEEKGLLQHILEAEEKNNYLIRDKALLRKEIIPLLRANLK